MGSSWRETARFSIEPLELRLLQAATYFIATTGNDTTGDGSAGNPFATIQHAAALVQPGDIVNVTAGQYGGFVLGWDAPQSGTAIAPITFNAEPGAIISSRDGKTPDGIDLEAGCNYININNFTIQNGDATITSAGIKVAGSDHVNIIGNTCTGLGTWGIFTDHSNFTLIQNNITSGSIKQHGIYCSNSSDHITITGNTVFGNSNCGIHLNGDVSEGGNGLMTNAVITNNIIYNNGATGGSAINCDGVVGAVIENNLMYGNLSAAISFFQTDASAPSTGNLVANNTIDMASTARWAIVINTASTGNVLFNNVIFSTNPLRGSIDITTDSLVGFQSDYNVVSSQFGLNDIVTQAASWQSQTGQDAHSIVSTDTNVFTNVAANDFHLASNSPALNAGIVSFAGFTAPAVDIQSNPRPTSGVTDIGAYQLSPLAPPPATPTNLAPANLSTGINQTPTLSASAFSDTDGDTQSAAEWIVRRTSDSTIVIDSGTDTADLNSFTVQAGSLTGSTSYSWQVRYKDSGAWWSAFSPATTFTTLDIAPNTPSNVAPAGGATSVSLTPTLSASAFSDPDNNTQSAAEWVITRTSDSAVVYDSGIDTSHLTTTLVPAGKLAAGVAYSWQVRYQDNGGAWSNYSAATGFTTAINFVPTLTITTPSGTQAGNVTITYVLADAESDPAGITVQFSSNAGVTWLPASVSGGDGLVGLTSSPAGIAHTIIWNSVANQGGVIGSEQIRITAASSGGAGVPASTSSFNLNNDVSAPSPATGSFAIPPVATGPASIRMVASTASDPSGVQYYFHETTGNPGGDDSGWQDSPEYIDTDLLPGTQYTYQVRTRDKSPAQNTGNFSAALSATTPASTPPNTGPSAQANVSIGSLAGSPNPVTRHSNLTLTATNVSSFNGDKVKSVVFFIDNNNDGAFDKGDTLFGRVASGKITVSFKHQVAPKSQLGAVTFSAVAIGNKGKSDVSTAVTSVVTILDAPPTIKKLVAPKNAKIGPSLKLSVAGLTDVDDKVAKVAFWLDANNNGLIDAGDMLLGTSIGKGGWKLSVDTSSYAPGTFMYLAQATDTAGSASNTVSASVKFK